MQRCHRLGKKSFSSDETNVGSYSKNSDNPYKELFGTCEYVSCQQHYWFNHKKNNDLFLIHFNVCSLQKHIDQFLNNYLVGFKNQPDIVAISETKLKEG